MKRSDVQHRLCCSDRRSPVDAFEQHRELRRRERHRSAGRLGPYEATSLQPLRQQAQAITIEPQHLHHVPATAMKDKHVTRQGLLFQHSLHLRTEAMKTSFACRSRLPQSRWACLREAQSRDQALQHGAETFSAIKVPRFLAQLTAQGFCLDIFTNSLVPGERLSILDTSRRITADVEGVIPLRSPASQPD